MNGSTEGNKIIVQVVQRATKFSFYSSLTQNSINPENFSFQCVMINYEYEKFIEIELVASLSFQNTLKRFPSNCRSLSMGNSFGAFLKARKALRICFYFFYG
jgi:hypothetical protein